MLVWIEGALNPDDLKTKILTDPDFKMCLMSYLEDTISTSVPNEPCSSPSVEVFTLPHQFLVDSLGIHLE